MDFGTIVGNFRSSNSHYPSVDAIMADINLVTNNAIKFNGERHQISQNARNAKAWFTKRMKDLPEDGDRDIWITWDARQHRDPFNTRRRLFT